MALLAMLGIEKAAAFSFTIVMHLMWSFPLLIAGLVLLWWTGYSGLKPKRGAGSPGLAEAYNPAGGAAVRGRDNRRAADPLTFPWRPVW